jgi:hypothetical protein
MHATAVNMHPRTINILLRWLTRPPGGLTCHLGDINMPPKFKMPSRVIDMPPKMINMPPRVINMPPRVD